MKAEQFYALLKDGDGWTNGDPMGIGQPAHWMGAIDHVTYQSDDPEFGQGSGVLRGWLSDRSGMASIALFPREEQFRLSKSCNCYHNRSGTRCWHAESLIKWLRGHTRTEFVDFFRTAVWNSYFNSLRSTSPQPPQPSARIATSEDKFVFHFEFLGHGKVPLARVRPALAKLKKNGDVRAKGIRPVQIFNGTLNPNPSGQVNCDTENLLWRLIGSMTATNYPGNDHVQSWQGFLKDDPILDGLLKALQTHPLTVDEFDPVFSWGPTVDATAQWVREKGNVQRMQLSWLREGHELADGEIFPFHIGPISLYAKLTDSTVGLINRAPAELRVAMTIPDVRATEADEIRRRLGKLALPQTFPLPQPSAPVVEVRKPLEAVLLLRKNNGNFNIFTQVEWGGFSPPADFDKSAYFEVEKDEQRFHVFVDHAAQSELHARVTKAFSSHSLSTGYRNTFDLQGYRDVAEMISDVHRIGRHLGLPVQISPDLNLTLLDKVPEFEGGIGNLPEEGWLSMGIGLNVRGRQVALLPIIRQLMESGRLLLDPPAPPNADRMITGGTEPVNEDDTIWVDLGDNLLAPIPIERIRKIVRPILDWLMARKLEKDGSLKMRASGLGSIRALSDSGAARFAIPAGIQDWFERFQRPPVLLQQAETFKGELRHYQREGLTWMATLSDLGLGGVLADDTGLGKTVQMISLILHRASLRKPDQPTLIVVELSLLSQWISKIAEFAPHLKLLLMHGTGRHPQLDDLKAHDAVLTTYQTLLRDVDFYAPVTFDLLLMDETRNIKNARSQVVQAISRIKARQRVAAGGTVLENNLGELWSVLDTCEPGVLGSFSQFRRDFVLPIEREGESGPHQRLLQRIAPLMLRRRKSEVLKDLPDKVINVVRCDMSDDQRDFYETIRVLVSTEIMELIAEQGIKNSEMETTQKLLRLRQVCDSPALVKGAKGEGVSSSKELWIEENLPEMVEQGRRILVFSEWTGVLDRVEAILIRLAIPYSYIQGGQSKKVRSEQIEAVKAGDVPVALVSIKAGGVGLDLPKADTIITVEPQWNPQMETQAEDRAWRDGQKNKVMVYRLIVPGTLEEEIMNIQEKKRRLSASILDNEAVSKFHLTEGDIRALLAPMK